MGISVTDSKLGELARMISGWPGLVSGSAQDLIDDSLVLLDHLGEALRLVDVGSGGGLPGLPLKIARPSLAVTLIEADQANAGAVSPPSRTRSTQASVSDADGSLNLGAGVGC